ncbi:hypothetical protein AX16_003337 [Volvariella volvacea WC 439]|nr:hypothetical protein AX16_003337 [Volvariella volvacea WC 439]
MSGRTRLTLLVCAALAAARQHPPPEFSVPPSTAFDYVNPLIGNGGDTPNGSGGMIPSTAPPFGMTRWVAQTHRNYVSVTPYNWTAQTIHGFQATRQPAIWMGESGSLGVVPGYQVEGGNVKVEFDERGLKIVKESEVLTPSYYSVELLDPEDQKRKVTVEQTATSRVGHLRFTFDSSPSTAATPYILFEVSRPSILTSTPTNTTYPPGGLTIHPRQNALCGWNSERQDWIIAPTSIRDRAAGFKGWFCAKFDQPLEVYGVRVNETEVDGLVVGDEDGIDAEGPLTSVWFKFPQGGEGPFVVNVRVGTSFISDEQALINLDDEIPDGTSIEQTAEGVRKAWIEKLDRIQIEDDSSGEQEVEKEVFYTGVFHSLQYPSEQHEYSNEGLYYSGYLDSVQRASESYTGYSIWDTYRAEWAWLILFAPERVPGMIRSMLADYQEGGWLPMWKNIVETNIMVGTHADSLIAEAYVKGVRGFNLDVAWAAVWKDATVPPENDWTTLYDDREENVDYEVRAGLSSVYEASGWVADDFHSESASRTLAYAYDDYAVAVLADHLNKSQRVVNHFYTRAREAPFKLFNAHTGFMEARNADGGWAGGERGWTEGDKWAYTFDVVHAIPELIDRRGGPAGFVKSLDEHFDGGHNDHTNEPSHHIPYLYALAGAAYKTQEKVREIAKSDYNNTPNGLSGNEDCGQMSAWYIFSAMGFYPVNPVSGEYVVGSPFFDKITIKLPPRPSYDPPVFEERTLVIKAPGARTKKYVKSLRINGEVVDGPVIRHEQIRDGGEVVFEMSDKIEEWGNELWLAQKEEKLAVDEREQVVFVGEDERQHDEL